MTLAQKLHPSRFTAMFEDEKRSGCASPQDITFWQAEVARLYRAWEEAVS